MDRLTPSDVHNVAFRKPAIGKRGYDERDVDDFLDRVEFTLTDMRAEIDSLRGQLGGVGGQAPVRGAEPFDAGQHAVLAELDLIKVRLMRIEAALASGQSRGNFGDATLGGAL